MPRHSFRATSVPGRVLLSTTVVLALIAGVAVSSGLRTKPEHKVRTIIRPPDVIVPQDAIGCPTDSDCQVSSGIPESMTQAIKQRFPRATPQWQSTTATKNGGAQRLLAMFSLNGQADTLMVNAECQPGSHSLADRRESGSADQRSDLSGNQISLVTMREIVVSGAPGCTTDLIIDAIGDADRYQSGLRSLAADPAMQVRR